MNQKTVAFLVLLGALIGFTRHAIAQSNNSGPELKFDTSATVSPESAPAKKDFVYGEDPIGKFGSESTYVKLGGYASVRFESDSAQDVNDSFIFRRLVFTTDAKIASRFRIYTELEFERFRKVELERELIANPGGGFTAVEEIEGTNSSEIALEQAWFQLEFKNWIRLQGGAVLIPLGRFNINHDDNQWNLPRRSLVDRGVPVLATTSAWDELGFGLNGDFELGEKQRLNYQIFVVNGAVMDAEIVNTIQTRPGTTTLNQVNANFNVSTGSFSNDVKNAKTVTGRVMWSPAIGHEFGFSGYWGRYTPSYLPSKNLTSFGFDTLQVWKNFEVEGEYIFTHLGGLRQAVDGLAAQIYDQSSSSSDSTVTPGIQTVVEFNPSGMSATKQGYWLELRYRWRPSWLTNSFFGKYFSDPQLIPIGRWEQAFLNDRISNVTYAGGAVTNYQTQNRFVNRGTVGLAFRLNPLAVFQLAYEYTWTNSGQPLAEVVNYLATPSSSNSSFMFGAAFGF